MPFELSESSSDAVRRFKQCLSKLETEEGRMKGVNFQPEPEDVICATTAKSGTTWVLQIVQSLRSRGDMSFEELNMVIPCLEMGFDAGMDINAPQPWSPRVFKTHFWYRDVPKGAGKYVYCTRDPLEVGPSFFYFLQGWFFDPGDLELELFLREFFLARGAPPTAMQNASHWHNVASWYPRRRDPNVLWLHFEDLQEDLPACVKLIAEFLQLGQGDPELQALAAQQSSIQSMLEHPTKYDEHPLKLARNEACGRPRDAGLGQGSTGKVRHGGSGRNTAELSPELQRDLQARWEEVVQPATGYSSYAGMRQGINRELGRPFASCTSPA